MLLAKIADRFIEKRVYVFALFWLLTFLVYLPAAKAGFVSDTTGWYQSILRDGFMDYINRARFDVKSMYQVTQFNTWIIYKILGVSPWPWHLIFVTMHAFVCSLLYRLFAQLFKDSNLSNGAKVALAGSVLFCISPYASEVIVWEASFHYPQALILIFGILLLVQQFQQKASLGIALGASLLFLISTFTHELFYLTPALSLAFILYYRIALNRTKDTFNKSLLYFILPQVILFLLHILLFRIVYGGTVAHVGSRLFDNPPGYFLVKAPWYFFHLFAFGRFWPADVRMLIYDVFRTPGGAIAFYGLIALLCVLIVIRLRRMNRYWRLVSFTFIYLLIGLSILAPMWFPEKLLVICDRYLYLVLGFQWMLVVLLLSRLRTKWLRYGILVIVAGLSIYLTLDLSIKWRQSARVIASLQNSGYLKPGKKKLLLNSPASFQGIAMIGTAPEGEFRLMHNLFFKPIIKDSMLEVASYIMNTSKDGAHVQVVNDTLLKVTLNQKGSGWQLGSLDAHSYDHNWYRLEMQATGNSYFLKLKRPATDFDILYQTDSTLQLVDMGKRGVEQF